MSFALRAHRARVARLAAALLMTTSLLLPSAPAAHAAPTSALITGEVERITLNNPNDVWSGGKMVIGGQNVTIPRNLLMDLPANRLTLQQLFAAAPPVCLGRAESGLAKADACNTSGAGAIVTIAANRTNAGDVIAGDVFIQKGIEFVTGVVTYIDYTDGYFRLNGLPGDAATGVMVRLNDPDGRHTVQHGLGCTGGANCSPDPRFTLDPNNYTNTFATGYPVCLPSTVARPFVDILDFNGNGNTMEQLIAQSAADGTGDVLCPATNRSGPVVDDSRRFAPIQPGDHLTAKGNFETIRGVRFLSAWSTRVARALTTKNEPGQPDYMLLDELFIDAPGFQLNRIRDQFIGYTTAVNADVAIWSVHYDPLTNAPTEFPLATVRGCEVAAGAGACAGVLGPNSFRIRHDVPFNAALRKLRDDPCAHLRADPRFATLNSCPQGGQLAEAFGILSPIPHEVQARTGLKMADEARPGGPTLRTLDLLGRDTTNGQYLFPMGIGLGGIETPTFAEINVNALDTPYSFDGIPWNLDRRLSPGGCVGPCESAPQPLDPFPVSGFDPRKQANTPSGPFSTPLYTASTLSNASDRIMSYVNGALHNFNGDKTVLSWPPLDPPGQGITPTPPFAVNPPRALITGVTPAAGPVGTRVVIDGSGLSGATAVTFGGVPATTFANLSGTQVSAVVPAGAASGPVAVTTAAAAVNSLIRFTVVPAPAISGFTPGGGPVGSSLTINGSGLTSATDVAVNGVSAPFTVVSDTAIRAAVPTGANTGPITVTTAGGTATSSGAFSVQPAPTIASTAPASGPAGTTVVVTGTGLTGVTGVTFGGVAATVFTPVSSTQLSAVVPAGALSGPISLTLASGPSATGPSFTVLPTADLGLVVASAPDPATVGATLTYSLTVSNNGPASATATTLTDTLPAGVSFSSATSSQGTCTQTAGLVTCKLGTLANGATATATVVVIPTSAAGGSFANSATVAATEVDPAPANNTARVVNHYPVAAPVSQPAPSNPAPAPSQPAGSGGSGGSTSSSSRSTSSNTGGSTSSGGSSASQASAAPASVAASPVASLSPSITIDAPSPQPAPAPVSDPVVAEPPAQAAPAPAGDPTSAAVTAVVDPAVGATVVGPGGVTVVVPPGAHTGMMVLTVGEDATRGNLRVGARLLVLRAVDAAGSSILAFDQPLSLTIRPTDADLAAAAGDAGAIPVSILDPDSGAFTPLAAALNEDGTLSVSLTSLAPATLALEPPQEVTAESSPVDDSAALAPEPAESSDAVADPTDVEDAG